MTDNATQKQINKILNLVKGWTQEQIEELLKPYGRSNIYELKKKEASEIIDKLTKKEKETAGKVIIEESQPAKVEIIKYERGGFGFKISCRGKELKQVLKDVIEACTNIIEEIEEWEKKKINVETVE